jgi:hypothetical protein
VGAGTYTALNVTAALIASLPSITLACFVLMFTSAAFGESQERP